MDRGNDKIQAGQDFIRVVKGSILQDIALCAFEDTQATGIFFVQAVDLFLLAAQIIFA